MELVKSQKSQSGQESKIPAHKLELFRPIARSLRIALKNSVFYPSEHPIYIYTIDNFKNALDIWFRHNERMDLGISQDRVFIDGEPIQEKDECYSEVANYLHMRGIISLSILRGITKDEVTEFFNFIRNDRKTIIEKGGIIKNLSKHGHLQIKEIDYSALLARIKNKSVSEEEKVWKFLFDVAKESKDGKLPENKVDFLKDFFTDTKKSVKILNKVYTEAVSKLQDEEAAKEIREAILHICQYFEENTKENAKDLKVKLMNVISQLHPDLISILFEKTVGGEHDFDLVDAISKDFSEGFIAEFIESLMNNEDTFNENLLKLFDKITPEDTEANNLVMKAADNLFSKKVLNPDLLTKLQMSIREIFKRHPDSNFMNQIYKITVNSVINKKINSLVYMARLTPLINKFVQSMEKGELRKEKLWLLLNVLWLENDADEFKKFTEKVVSILPALIDSKDTHRIREIVEFFSEKVRPEQLKDQQLSSEIKSGLERITDKETIDSLVALIPEASKSELVNIAYTLYKSDNNTPKILIDAFIAERNPAYRNKFMYVFLTMKSRIAVEVINRLEYCKPYVVRDLFFILKHCTPQKAHLIAKKLMSHKSPQIRWVALNEFEPMHDTEVYKVYSIYKKEKHREVKKKAATVLLKTRSSDIIMKVFKHAQWNLFNRYFLIHLVELCGKLRAVDTYPYLEGLFLKRALLNTKKRDDMRTTVISSLARLKIPEATQLVRRGLQDRSRRVREQSEIILKLAE